MNRYPRTPRRCAAFVLAAIGVLLTTGQAMASTVVALNVDELTDRSRQIFHGVCIESHAAIEAGDIVTRLRFAVAEDLRGADADTVDIVLPGGVMDGQRYSISGMPTFTVGQEVVLFLSEPDDAGRVWPIGLAQGGFHVQRPAGKPARVRRDYSELRFHESAARPAAAATRDLRLDDLLRAVRARTAPASGAAQR